jgi:serine/threonine protein kinase
VVTPTEDARDIPQSFVYGILLEGIDGISIVSVDPSVHDFTSLGHALMAIVHAFSGYGVIHDDIRGDNILISPTRAVIIDFGQAILRKANTDDRAWAEQVEEEDEVDALRCVLHHRKIRDCTPFVPVTLFRGFAHFNNRVAPQPEAVVR